MTRHAATDAVSALLRPAAMVVEVTPAVRYTVRAPCLLAQLVACVALGMEKGGGRGVPGSRSPVALEALDLFHEITHDAHAWARELDVPRRDPRDDHPIPWAGRLLRSATAAAIAKGQTETAERIERSALRWYRQITAMVTGTPEQRGVRGAPCPECSTEESGPVTQVTEERPGEGVFKVPAIVLVVRDIEGGRLRWLACRACGWSMTLGEEYDAAAPQLDVA